MGPGLSHCPPLSKQMASHQHPLAASLQQLGRATVYQLALGCGARDFQEPGYTLSIRTYTRSEVQRPWKSIIGNRPERLTRRRRVGYFITLNQTLSRNIWVGSQIIKTFLDFICFPENIDRLRKLKKSLNGYDQTVIARAMAPGPWPISKAMAHGRGLRHCPPPQQSMRFLDTFKIFRCISSLINQCVLKFELLINN